MDKPGNIYHINFLGYAHWFMSIIISQIKDHSISVGQAIYDKYIVAKYQYTATINKIQSLVRLPYLMI